jgi:hypothetical protein
MNDVVNGRFGALRQSPPPPMQVRAAAAATTDVAPRVGYVIAIILLHVPLALVMSRSTAAATVHAFVTLGIAFWFAGVGKRVDRIAYMGAYIIGAEVLWRQTGAMVFWESGKYAVSAIFLLGLMRFRAGTKPALPVLYFMMLLPSALLTMEVLDVADARGQLSFNLSGPLALTVCALFFSQVRLTRNQIHRLFLAAIAPIVGITTVAVFHTATTKAINFGTEAVFATSGGFGPNQVSGVMGLGVLLCLLYIVGERQSMAIRLFLLGTMLVMATQSALTFSRSGLYCALGAAALAFLFLIRDARTRMRFIVMGAVLFAVGNFVIFPALESFTGGALSARYQKKGLTGRDEIARSDLELWARNPIFGVGPGVGYTARTEELGYRSAAHTEFSRLLSEHGSLGLIALLLLIGMTITRLRRAGSPRAKALTTAFLTWSILFMAVNAMRIAAPSFCFGLAFATLVPEDLLEQVAARVAPVAQRFRPTAMPRRVTPDGLTDGRV